MASTSSVRTCYNCGDPNHFARWCPHKTAAATGNLGTGNAPILTLPTPPISLPTLPPPPPPPASQTTVGGVSGNTNGQYTKGSGWFNLNQRMAVLEETVVKMKTWYDLAMANELARKEEEEKLKKAKEEEERRLLDKKEREALNKELHDAMNARLDVVYEAVRGQKQADVSGEEKMEKLLKEIEKLQVAQSEVTNNSGASTSRPSVHDDALLAKMMQEHEDMKRRVALASAANKRAETLEASLRTIKQQQELAMQEVETWKKEALRTGNKRSRLATSSSAQLKIPATPPRKSSNDRPSIDPLQLAQLHTLEVNALKELRLNS
ncbi:hypothetical protein CBR_g9055 [Chara braunii]|uniref:CCHC-type domain-containing protein n=1 Tax=Chara braunii TaxID=69332 RepID=A0A388KNK8_CHABU|nr:hypothetical protein CBR_g9055 [Chara braunii]|eukprot:GBG71639.1 hypothetical protein CBR_g9055 [Chara braunii]